MIAISVIPAWASSSAESHWANAVGWRASSGPAVAIARSAAARYRGSPVSAVSRSRTVAATAPPDGTALSCRSRGRTTSRSASSAVSKKPPEGSAKWASIDLRQRHGLGEPPFVGGRLVQGEEPLRHVGMVLQHAVCGRTPVHPRSPESPVRLSQVLEDVRRRGRCRVAVPHGIAGQGRVARRVDRPGCIGQGPDRQTVPGREHLAVPGGLGARRAPLQQRGPRSPPAVSPPPTPAARTAPAQARGRREPATGSCGRPSCPRP